MTDQFGEYDHDSEYPEYSESGGGGNERFAPPSKGSGRRGWRMRNNRVQNHTPPPSASPAPPLTRSTTPSAPSAQSAQSTQQTPSQQWQVPPAPVPPSSPYQVPSPSESEPSATEPAPSEAPPNPYGAPPGSTSPSKSKGRKSGHWVVLGVIVAAVILVIIAINSGGSGSSNPGTGGSGTSASPPPVVPTPSVTPPAADPQSFEEAIVEFDEFTVRGTGDHEFKLPDGVVNGVVDIVANGDWYVDVTAFDQRGDRHGSIAWGQSDDGRYEATAVFGTYDYDGDYPSSIEVRARDSWQLTFRPISTLDEFPETYEQDHEGAAVFLYDGPGETVEIVFDSDDDRYAYFTLDQENLIDFSSNVLRLNRSATVTIDLDPGPNVIVIEPDGASFWSISLVP